MLVSDSQPHCQQAHGIERVFLAVCDSLLLSARRKTMARVVQERHQNTTSTDFLTQVPPSIPFLISGPSSEGSELSPFALPLSAWAFVLLLRIHTQVLLFLGQ